MTAVTIWLSESLHLSSIRTPISYLGESYFAGINVSGISADIPMEQRPKTRDKARR